MTDTNAIKTCRGCQKPLTVDNARMWGGRFIGACRSCEATEARERYVRANPDAKYYNDSRRKYTLA